MYNNQKIYLKPRFENIDVSCKSDRESKESVIYIHIQYTGERTNSLNMHSQNIANLVLICLGVFVTGVSLTLLAPFYPSEALKKVYINPIFIDV